MGGYWIWSEKGGVREGGREKGWEGREGGGENLRRKIKVKKRKGGGGGGCTADKKGEGVLGGACSVNRD